MHSLWTNYNQKHFNFLNRERIKKRIKLLNEVILQNCLQEKPRRYYLKDKRKRTIKTIYGEICIERDYYYDLQTKKYVCLLDKYIGLQKRFKYDQEYEKAILRLIKLV